MPAVVLSARSLSGAVAIDLGCHTFRRGTRVRLPTWQNCFMTKVLVRHHPTQTHIDRLRCKTWNVILISQFTGTFNDDISKWNTNRVTNMGGMFWIASSFNQPIATWNTSQVTNMSGMFSFASSFNQPIATWNTSQVTNMIRMFFGASSYSHPKPKGAQGCQY